MTPFVTEVAGCTCARCIAFGTPIVAAGGGGPVVPATDPAVLAAPAGTLAAPLALPAAPHEFWDRTTPPPIDGFVDGVVGATEVTGQTVVPPMGAQAATGLAEVPPANVTVPPQPREVQIVPVGTPLADVVGLPGNPFLD